MRSFAFLVVLVALAAGGYYGYHWWNRPDTSVTYRTEPVERGDVVASVMATGVVEPLVKVLVGSQVSGTVVKWYADFNAPVKENDVLAILDQDRIDATIAQRSAAVAVARAQLAQAQADVQELTARKAEAEAQLAQARLDRSRIEDAYQRKVASDFEFDQSKISQQSAESAVAAAAAAVRSAEAQVASAQAQVQAAEAELQSAQIEKSKTVIRSPIDGVVISRDIDEGQTVAASLSAPTLFTIANDLRKMRVNAAVSETDIGRVREGLEAEFRVDAFPQRRFRGIVTQVRYAETVVDNVVTYQTLIDVDNPELLLRPGMTATISFEVDRADGVLTVPNSALRFDPDYVPQEINRQPGRGRTVESRVYTLQDGTLVEVPVELGINDGSRTEIRSDRLQAGTPVVVEQTRTGGPTASPRSMLRSM